MARRPRGEAPSYRHHKASGQAVVTLNGRDHYLGPWSDDRAAPSWVEYRRLIGEWEQGGRAPLGTARAQDGRSDLTIAELMLAYSKHVEAYYRKGGEPTETVRKIKDTLRPVRESYAATPAVDFGPLALQAVRQTFVDRGLCRRVVNEHVHRIRAMFAWGVSQELIPETVHRALLTVKALAAGRTRAKDHAPVAPAPLDHVRAAQRFVRPQVAAMIDLQLLTGMRPGEVCLMRAADVDRSGDVWTYIPESHKTEHRGRSRSIPLGPRAQAILAPWLLRFPDGYLFRPVRWAESKGSKRTPKGVLRVVGRYAPGSYAKVVAKACRRAGVPHWHPHQLRHNAATLIRSKFDRDSAKAILGHADPKVTDIYAAIDQAKAVDVARAIG